MYTKRERYLDLNGIWKFAPDSMKRGIRQTWWKKERGPYDAFPCWDMEGLWDMEVPSTWNCAVPELKYYEGYGVYVRDFSCEELGDDEEAYLCFDGAVYATEVWLNGVWVGKHECGYSPFQFCVTPLLQEQNRLMVYVENLRKPDRVPGEIFDWWNDGGLIRPVSLVIVPAFHVRNFAVRTRLAGEEVELEVEVEVECRDRTTAREVEILLPELQLMGKVLVSPQAPATASFRLRREQVELWAPGQPKRYEIRLRTAGETVRDMVGLREVRVEGRDILLNGERIELWGVCAHAEFKERGRSDSPRLLDEFFALVRDLGANFVRCAHYPYSDAFVRRAEEEGILLWEEVPAYWQVRMDEAPVKALAFQMLREMIDRDRNRASVIIWSVSNECEWKNPEGDDGNYRYGIEAAALVRSLDPTRLISSAEAYVIMGRNPWDPAHADQFEYAGAAQRHWRGSLPEEYYAAMDILAMNNYVGAFGENSQVEDIGPALRYWYRYNKPVMISEFGGLSKRGDQRDDLTVGGEKRHVDVARRAYAVLEGEPWVAGAAIWNLIDMRTPLHWQDFSDGLSVARYGLVDEQWQRKQVFEVVKEWCRRKLGR